MKEFNKVPSLGRAVEELTAIKEHMKSMEEKVSPHGAGLTRGTHAQAVRAIGATECVYCAHLSCS